MPGSLTSRRLKSHQLDDLMLVKLAKSMQAALDLTRSGDLAGATRAIQDVLAGPKGKTAEDSAGGRTIDLDAGSWSETPESPGTAAPTPPEDPDKTGRKVRPLHDVIGALARLKRRFVDSTVPADRRQHHAPKLPAGARFETRSITTPQGSRLCKVYIPARTLAEPRSLLIMLHGCTQTPEDFAAGTRMNHLAERNGFIVAYPAQPKSANSSACWNWFNPQNQARGMGEAAMIAAQAQSLVAEFGIDPRRVFVAGLSAGGAMAAVMAATYPDIFSGVGIHSGLPYRSASDVVTALAAMRGQGAAKMQRNGEAAPIPTIVFHGTADHIVHPSNGAKIADAHLGSRETHSGLTGEGKGRPFQRILTRDQDGRITAEHWIIEGAGHAWSGGSTEGSFADPLGPDASREMVRFFLS
jgi:poly(hydroxyalkanoate) depolymerase family esterase